MIDAPTGEEVEKQAFDTLVNLDQEATAVSVLLLYLVRQMTDLQRKDESYRNGLLHILGRVSDLLQLPTTPLSQQVQPIIHVNIDTGAISQALLLGMKVLIEQQTQALVDGLSKAHKTVESAHSEMENGSQNGSQNDEPMNRSIPANKANAKRVIGSQHLEPIAVRKFRKTHTIPETARHFGMSESTIKRTLKG